MKYLGLLFCGIVFSVLSNHDHDFSHHLPHHSSKSESERSLFVSAMILPFKAGKWVLHGAFATLRDFSGGIAIAGAIVATVAGVAYMQQENRGTVRKWWDKAGTAFDGVIDKNQEKHLILDNLGLITVGGAIAFVGGGITYILTKGLAHSTK